MKIFLVSCLLICFKISNAQTPDRVYKPNIRSITLTRYADIYSYPVMMLNSADQFELHFDDMEESHQRMLAAVLSILLYHRN